MTPKTLRSPLALAILAAATLANADVELTPVTVEDGKHGRALMASPDVTF